MSIFCMRQLISSCVFKTQCYDDAWKITSEVHGKHAIQRHLHNTKRKDLTESIGVVPAKYPPKVKLELLTTLEC